MKKIALIAASVFLFVSLSSFCPEISGVLGVGSAMAKKIDYDALLDEYTDQYTQSDDKHRATFLTEEYEAPRRYIYEEPTVKNYSYLFWAVNMYKFEDDEAVDEFMRINECEIFKNYASDELEWKQIREATREFLRDNKEDFPTRFEFMMPLKLLDYDEERQAFEIQDEFKIESLRRFEFFSKDFNMHPCSKDHIVARGYPRVLVLEFSRPFNLVHVPMQRSVALDYIKRKMDLFHKKYEVQQTRTRARMYAMRDATLVMKVKIFSYGKMLGVNNYGYGVVQMMGVLEGFEIYETSEKQNLFFAQNYVTAQSKGKLDKHLKAQYELLMQKHKGEGLFH